MTRTIKGPQEHTTDSRKCGARVAVTVFRRPADMRLAKPQLDPQLDLTAQAAARPQARVAHTDLIAEATICQ
jgi:hypothetical protein